MTVLSQHCSLSNPGLGKGGQPTYRHREVLFGEWGLRTYQPDCFCQFSAEISHPKVCEIGVHREALASFISLDAKHLKPTVQLTFSLYTHVFGWQGSV